MLQLKFQINFFLLGEISRIKLSANLHKSSILNDLYASLGLKAMLRMGSSTTCSLNLFFNYCNWKSIALVNISTLK
jgi:hypothetical protein